MKFEVKWFWKGCKYTIIYSKRHMLSALGLPYTAYEPIFYCTYLQANESFCLKDDNTRSAICHQSSLQPCTNSTTLREVQLVTRLIVIIVPPRLRYWDLCKDKVKIQKSMVVNISLNITNGNLFNSISTSICRVLLCIGHFNLGFFHSSCRNNLFIVRCQMKQWNRGH